jgi:phosphatidylserine decarboxylase
MTLRNGILRLLAQDDLNFLLTNRIPRRFATSFIGWFSRIEQPVVRDLSIGLWRFFSDVDLSDAKESHFRSLRDCFIRELRDDARPIERDPSLLVSPCDAIVGASGAIAGTKLYQIKGRSYALDDLMGDRDMVDAHRDGRYVTLRLTAGMYHRFHAPHDCRVERVTYMSGDTWNVNPIALRRVDALFCKNERVLVKTRLSATGHCVSLVAVAAILVAGIRLNFLDIVFNSARRGPNVMACDAGLAKGEEMGWFEHGSTILVFAPSDFALCDNVKEGATIRLGEPLMRFPH